LFSARARARARVKVERRLQAPELAGVVWRFAGATWLCWWLVMARPGWIPVILGIPATRDLRSVNPPDRPPRRLQAHAGLQRRARSLP